MRKKLLIINSLLIFLSIFLVVLIMSLTLQSENTKKSENQLRSYLTLASTSLDYRLAYETPAKALDDTGKELHSADLSLRVTFISRNGDVLFDSSKEEIGENHLSRPEIQSLGTIYYRYSETMKTDMMYVASLDSSSTYYIRLSLPKYDTEKLVYNLVLYGSLAGVGLLAISVIADYLLTKRAFKPLKEESQRLSSIVGAPCLPLGKEDESIAISKGIRQAGEIIQEKVFSLKEEKSKLSFILDTLKDGLLILDGGLNVIIANQSARMILKIGEEGSSPRLLSDVTINKDINELAKKASRDEEGSLIKTLPDGKTYLVSFYPIKENWCLKDGGFGVGINFSDISEEIHLQSSKRDFFANASHELKSPLTTIIGYSELIATGMISDKDEEKKSLEKILSEAKRMNQIIVQMLELSKLESDYVPVSVGQNPKSVILDIFHTIEDRAKECEVSLSLEGEGFEVEMAKNDIESLFRNLIENGIRYNNKGGMVLAILDKDKKTVIIKDNGIGISPKDQSSIFERFYRVDKARSRKLGGTGLGLSIVKHLCLIYHIAMKLESRLGEGSSFILTFPSI